MTKHHQFSEEVKEAARLRQLRAAICRCCKDKGGEYCRRLCLFRENYPLKEPYHTLDRPEIVRISAPGEVVF